MKRIIGILLLVLLIACITSCGLIKGKEPEDGFIDEDVLDDFKLSDMPVPSEEVKHVGNKAYLSMEDKYYRTYCRKIKSYLLEKEDVYHKGYHYETGCAGGIFFIPEYRFSALKDDTDATVGWFIFSLTEELNGGDEYNKSYSNGVFIKIQQKSGKIGSFEYNTVIEICESYCAVRGVAPHYDHTYEYVGNGHSHHKVYTCGCADGAEEKHVDGNGDNLCDLCANEHKHVYTEWYSNDEYHWNVGDCYWDICNLATYEKHYDENYDERCDVCEHAVMPETALLGEYERWLLELTPDDVAEIKLTFEYVAVQPGRLKDIKRTTDKAVIADILDKYANALMKTVSFDDTLVNGGSAHTIEFILQDGTVKRIFFNNRFYEYGLDEDGIHALAYFRLYSVPTLEGYDNVTSSKGFIVTKRTGTVYDKDNNPVCEVPISKLEFVHFDDDLPAVETGYFYRVDTQFGTLWFTYSSDIFYLQLDGEDDRVVFYRLVDKNLDELIACATSVGYSSVSSASGVGYIPDATEI